MSPGSLSTILLPFLSFGKEAAEVEWDRMFRIWSRLPLAQMGEETRFTQSSGTLYTFISTSLWPPGILFSEFRI